MGLKALPRLETVNPNVAAKRLGRALHSPAGTVPIVRRDDVEALYWALGPRTYTEADRLAIEATLHAARFAGSRTLDLPNEIIRALIAPLAEP
ncbi:MULTISPECIES: hypothetical protein [Methylosinus]|uniref:hypothetical protein n=1 Tax=Methylosinus TaxID=425 RepID=UPI0001D2DF52|nr:MULTISPECIES: hypothetical protein [Methylosinus]